MKKQTLFAICMIFVTSEMLAGCGSDDSEVKQTSDIARAAYFKVAEQAEEKGDLHEAEKYYQKAIEQAEQDGYVEESHHEARHRVREKLNQKYGKGDQ